MSIKQAFKTPQSSRCLLDDRTEVIRVVYQGYFQECFQECFLEYFLECFLECFLTSLSSLCDRKIGPVITVHCASAICCAKLSNHTMCTVDLVTGNEETSVYSVGLYNHGCVKWSQPRLECHFMQLRASAKIGPPGQICRPQPRAARVAFWLSVDE
jgi:hypothetical protein